MRVNLVDWPEDQGPDGQGVPWGQEQKPATKIAVQEILNLWG